MLHHRILSAIGSDRPGIVDEVSQFIFEHGGNIEDSRMVNLRGQFAIIMLIGGPDAALARLRDDLATLTSRSQLHVELHPSAAEHSPAATTALPYRLTATAMDQAGLVQRIAHLLRTMNINIESLQSTLAAAPITGAPIFEMELILSVPAQTTIASLRDALTKLCDQLNIDYQLAAM